MGKRKGRTPSKVVVLAALLLIGAACELGRLFGGSGQKGHGDGPGEPGGPLVPAELVQLESDSATPIPTGGFVPELAIVVRALVSDTQAGTFRLEAEVQPVGSPFEGQATAAGAPMSGPGRTHVRITGLADNTAYHWRARVVPETGAPGAWWSFGDNADGVADVRVGLPVGGPRLTFTRPPATTTAGVTIPEFHVVAVNGQGDTVTSFAGTVFLSISEGPVGSVLGGTPQANAVAGVARFTGMRITTAGTYRLGATADGVASATSTLFAINPLADIDRIVFIVQPSDVEQNKSITPAVKAAALDVYGNVVSSFTGTMYMNIGFDAGGGAQLDPAGAHSGAQAGVGTFANLRINRVGLRYTLVVSSSGGGRGETSDAFNVTPALPP